MSAGRSARTGRRILAALAVTAISVAACTPSGTGSDPTSTGPNSQSPTSGAPTPGPGPTNVDSFVRDLADAGIGVYSLGASEPVTPVAHPTAVRLTDEQAANAALNAAAHSGMTGAQLDTVVAPPPLAADAQPIPTSALLAAWSQTADSPAARMAKRLLGAQDWTDYRQLVFPTIVLALFTADYLGTARPAAAAPDSGASSLLDNAWTDSSIAALGGATSICQKFQSFVNDTITEVFAAIGHLPTWDTATGAGWLRILKRVANLPLHAINLAIDGVEIAVREGVKTALAPVISAVAAVASVVAVAASVLLAIEPWVGEITPDPRFAHRTGDVHPGTFELAVRTVRPAQDKWPTEIEGCANAAGVSLPSLKPRDADVKWIVDYQSPEPMIRTTGDSGGLRKDGTATLRYETLAEPPDVAEGDEHPDGSVKVVVEIHRKDLDQVRDRLLDTLWRNIPLPQIVLNALTPILRPIIDPRVRDALKPLTELKDTHAFTILATNYHTAPDKPIGGPVSVHVDAQFHTPFGFISHVTLDAKSCAGAAGPWTGSLRMTHPPPIASDPSFDATFAVRYGFNAKGEAQIKIPNHPETITGKVHSESSYATVQLSKDKTAMTAIGFVAIEDGTAYSLLDRLSVAGKALPFKSGC